MSMSLKNGQTLFTQALHSFVIAIILFFGVIRFASADTTIGTNITTTGNIGVGTTSPQAVLDLKNSTSLATTSFSGTGLNDGSFGGSYLGANTATYTAYIDSTGSPDTFKWKKDSGNWSVSGTAITGSAQTLLDGVTLTFGATTGHTLNDQWSVTITVTNPLFAQNAGSSRTFVVANDGSIGIGTSAPISNIHSPWTEYFSSRLIDINGSPGSNSSGFSALILHPGGNSGQELSVGSNNNGLYFDAAGSSNAAGYNNIILRTSNTNSDYTPVERMRLTSAGYIGLGLTSPGGLFHAETNQNTATYSILSNQDTGTAAQTVLSVRNGSALTDGFNLRALGTGYTTSGAFVQDSAVLETGTNLAGGLSILARNSGANIRFYTGSHVDANERMRILSTGNIGIGATSPGDKLEVNGGVRLNTATAQPTCDSSHRGTMWFTQGSAGVKDVLEVCAKDATDTYAWRTLY